MNHEEIQDSLIEYSAGELSPADHSLIKGHVGNCLDCKEKLFLIKMMNAKGKAGLDSPSSFHPEAEDIVQFATHPDRLSAEDAEQLSTHFSDCYQCQEYLEFVRLAHDLPDGFSQPTLDRWTPSNYSNTVTKWAAAAIILLLLYPAYMGIRSTSPKSQPYIGGISSTQFSDPVLAPTIQEITLDQVKPYFQLTVSSKKFRDDSADSDQVEIIVRSEDGSDVAMNLQGQYSDFTNPNFSRNFILMVPSNGRQAGMYQIQLNNLTQPEISFSAQFKLVNP